MVIDTEHAVKAIYSMLAFVESSIRRIAAMNAGDGNRRG